MLFFLADTVLLLKPILHYNSYCVKIYLRLYNTLKSRNLYKIIPCFEDYVEDYVYYCCSYEGTNNFIQEVTLPPKVRPKFNCTRNEIRHLSNYALHVFLNL